MFALIHDNTVKVGPRTWSYSMFKIYLDENNLDSSLLQTKEPSSPIETETWQIYPVIFEPVRLYDDYFEQLQGPFLSIDFNEKVVRATFNVIPVELQFSKNKLKEKVTANRYAVEIAGCPHTFNDGTTVNIYTNREDRGVYVDKFLLMGENDTVTFKFSGSVFKQCTKSDLQSIIATGAQWIQNAFDWESSVYSQIDNCSTIEELKLINTTNPNQL